MNLSELHKLPDLLVVQGTVLSVVLADEVLQDAQCKVGCCALLTPFLCTSCTFKTKAYFFNSTVLLIEPVAGDSFWIAWYVMTVLLLLMLMYFECRT